MELSIAKYDVTLKCLLNRFSSRPEYWGTNDYVKYDLGTEESYWKLYVNTVMGKIADWSRLVALLEECQHRCSASLLEPIRLGPLRIKREFYKAFQQFERIREERPNCHLFDRLLFDYCVIATGSTIASRAFRLFVGASLSQILPKLERLCFHTDFGPSRWHSQSRVNLPGPTGLLNSAHSGIRQWATAAALYAIEKGRRELTTEDFLNAGRELDSEREVTPVGDKLSNLSLSEELAQIWSEYCRSHYDVGVSPRPADYLEFILALIRDGTTGYAKGLSEIGIDVDKYIDALHEIIDFPADGSRESLNRVFGIVDAAHEELRRHIESG